MASSLSPPEVPMQLHVANREKLLKSLRDHLSLFSRPLHGFVFLQGGEEQTRHCTDHVELFRARAQYVDWYKSLVLRRAKHIGHVDLAKKSDLIMLRGLSLVLMENLKGQLKQQGIIPGLTESLLKSDPDENFATLGTFVCNNRKKRIADMFDEDMMPSKRQKTAAGGLEQT